MPSSLTTVALLAALAIATAGASLLVTVLVCVAALLWEIMITWPQ